RQPKARVHCANALGFLFQQKDHRSVLEHRLAVLALGKVLELLAERYQAEVVLARSTSEICQEGASFGMAEQRGCFVDDELAGPPCPADAVPHVSGDDVDGQWLELGRKIPDLKNDQRLVEVDARRPCKQSTSQRAANVSLEPSSEPAGQFVRRLNQDAM